MAALPRSCKLLCSGREEASRLKEAQVRHRFVVTTLVSPTPGETKKWGSLSLCQLRKRWASPPKDVSTGRRDHRAMVIRNRPFAHPEKRFPRKRTVVAQAKEVQLVQRNGLSVEVEDGVGMSRTNLRFCRMRRVNHLHVTASAPRTTEGADGIEVPTHAPVSCVLGQNESSAQPKSVLWRHTAGGYVQRMV